MAANAPEPSARSAAARVGAPLPALPAGAVFPPVPGAMPQGALAALGGSAAQPVPPQGQRTDGLDQLFDDESSWDSI